MNLRLFLVLIALVAVICSSLGVVYMRHESRGWAVELGRLESQKDQIITDWSRLQLEQAMLSDAGSIESKASDSLGMKLPEETVILVVEP